MMAIFRRPPLRLACLALLLNVVIGLGCDMDSGPPFKGDNKPSTDAGDVCADLNDGEPCADDLYCLGGRCVAHVQNCTATGMCRPERPPEEEDAGDAGDAGDASDGQVQTDAADGSCGDGVIQTGRGEVCDGPQIVNLGGDAGGRRGCSDDCKQVVEEDECEKCQESMCRNVESVDVVSGCFEKVNPDAGADADDATFIPQCIEMVNCGLRNDCWFDKDAGVEGCYCGSASKATCMTTGPAEGAPCVSQWRAATRASSNADVWNNMADFKYPLNWGYKLLECYRDKCAAQCVPAP
jgi:hypothetical protein